jgi:hypothetical protein
VTDDGLKFDPARYAETLDRIRRDRDYGNPHDTIRPSFDAALNRDVVDDAKRGRHIDQYRQALESLGFRYYTPQQLGPFMDGQRRQEGEWRFRMGQLRLAFTSDEICGKYPGGPEEFFEEVARWKMEERARAAGIILPR